jgi:hypothetical protein
MATREAIAAFNIFISCCIRPADGKKKWSRGNGAWRVMALVHQAHFLRFKHVMVPANSALCTKKSLAAVAGRASNLEIDKISAGPVKEHKCMSSSPVT